MSGELYGLSGPGQRFVFAPPFQPGVPDGGSTVGLGEELAGALATLDKLVPLRDFVNAIMESLQSGSPAPLLAWIASAPGEWLHDFNDFTLGIAADFDEILAAFQGTYSGTDPVLTQIQAWASGLGALFGGNIPVGWLTRETPNLLPNGGFDGSVSMVEGEGWTYDGTVGRTTPGSARFDATGTAGLQLSDATPVAEGQELAAKVYVQWSGVTSSGATVTPEIRWYNGSTLVSSSALTTITDPPGSSSGTWVELSGTGTAPSGVTSAVLALSVTSSSTAGSFWFDDATLTKTSTSLPQAWVNGLTAALESLGDDVEAVLAWIKDLIEKLTGQARGTLTDALADVTTFASQLKTILSGGTVGSPLPTLVGATIGQIQAMLNQLMDILRGLTVTPVNSVVSEVKDWFTGLTGWKSTTTSNVSAAQSKADAVQAGIVNGWSGGSSSGTDAGVFDTMSAVRALVGGDGYTRVNVTSTTTWTKPGAATEVIVVGIAAGTSGNSGTAGSATSSGNGGNGGNGGTGGGHKVQALDPTEFSALYVEMGTAGASTRFRVNNSSGAVLAEATTGAGGAMATQFGYTSSGSQAGGGGGGAAASGASGGTSGNPGSGIGGGSNGNTGNQANGGPGGASAAAAGGAANGGSGGAVSTSAIPCGGGGGGGGKAGGVGIGAPAATSGGAGGFPGGGGGGGGGGASGGITSGPGGSGGAGASGFAIIFYR